jgi:phage tail-like protein
MARSSSVDALEKFRFSISWDGLKRAGFSEAGVPKRTTTKSEYREGNDPDNVQLFAGLSRMEDITLSRGSTTGQDFYDWAQLVFDGEKMPAGIPNVGKGQDVIPLGSSENYRKDITITLHHRNGQPAKQWVLYNAFPVSFQPGSDLNATEDGEKSIEQMTIGYENFTELKGSEISAPAVGIDQD